MAKFKVNENTLINVVDSSGNLKSMEEYVDEVDGVGESFEMIETTVLSNGAPTHIKGIEETRTWIMRGRHDDTAVQADAVFRGLITHTTPRSVQILPDGTRAIAGDFLLKRYDYIIVNKGAVRFEAEFVSTGGITIT